MNAKMNHDSHSYSHSNTVSFSLIEAIYACQTTELVHDNNLVFVRSQAIKRFTGPWSFLSNFHIGPTPISFEGSFGQVDYMTAEHAYQANKFVHEADHDRVAQQITPGRAKNAGRAKKEIQPDWDVVRVLVMAGVIHAKFNDVVLAQKLVDTYPMMLIEGNHWGDTFWGVTLDGEGTGRNALGTFLMEKRQRLIFVDGMTGRKQKQ